MRIVITGSEGYVGSTLARNLKDQHKLLLIDKKRSPKDDINSEACRKRIRQFKPDVIFNLAAISGEKACIEAKCPGTWATNLDSPFELRQNNPNAVFIQASSASVLAAKSMNDTPYAFSKKQLETELIESASACRGSTIILRFGTIFGVPTDLKYMRWDLPAHKMCRDVVLRSHITIRGSSLRRPWLDYDFLQRLFIDILEQVDMGWFNQYTAELRPVCTTNLTLSQMAKLIVAIAQKPIGTTTKTATDTRDYVMPVWCVNKNNFTVTLREILQAAK